MKRVTINVDVDVSVDLTDYIDKRNAPDVLKHIVEAKLAGIKDVFDAFGLNIPSIDNLADLERFNELVEKFNA